MTVFAIAGLYPALKAVQFARAEDPPIKLDRSKLTLTFSDDFDGPLFVWESATHAGRWKTNWFSGDPFGPSGRISNDEIVVDEAYCGINPFIPANGTLGLQLARTNSQDPRLGGKSLTAGLLTTERSFSQTYGYFECRFATPAVPGCWPSFWLYSAPVKDVSGTQWDNGLGYGREWTGGLNNEIDVVEILTNNLIQSNHTAMAKQAWKGSIPGTAFDPAFVPKKVGTHIASSQGTHQLHAYGVLWTKTEIAWYVDDIEIFRAPNPGIHDPMYLIVSMGAGGWNNNQLDANFSVATMTVDYVRAYRQESTPQR